MTFDEKDEMNGIGPPFHCPRHRLPLMCAGERLLCPDGDEFPIRSGIPRFVESGNYAMAFGSQWKRYPRTQLDSYSGLTITKDRARRCLGEYLWDNLLGRQVLECGCGAGRFTEILLDRGALVTSLDLSDAVEANQENFPQDDRHRIVQADITAMPFAQGQFDVVFCLGVVQHTPGPEKTISILFDQVIPGGVIIFDHYTYNLSWYTKLAPLYRQILKRMNPDAGLEYTKKLVDLFLPLHRRVRNCYFAQAVLSRVSPVICYYHSFPGLSDELQREWALLDTHDNLTDWYKHFRTRGQLLRTIERLGLEDIWCERGGNGIEIRGRRPLS